jgi:hypothetical protein
MDLTPLTNKLSSLQREKRTRSADPNHLLDTMPTLREWKQATDVRFGSRGTTSNAELLQIDAKLIDYFGGTRGCRAKAIREIATIIQVWKNRRGPQVNTSRRKDAMNMLEEIVNTLREEVVYDREKWLASQKITPLGPDRVNGGCGEGGHTVELVRLEMLREMTGPSSTYRNLDSLNEGNDLIVNAFGLKSGRDYSGGATCYSAAEWVCVHINGRVTRADGKPYDIKPLLSIEKNQGDSHRYVLDENDIIIDPTWRQFFRNLCGQGKPETPAIFVGTPDELEGIVMKAGASGDSANKISTKLYTGTRAKKKYGNSC